MKLFCVCLIFTICTFLRVTPSVWHQIIPQFGRQFVGDAFQKYTRITWNVCVDTCKSVRKCHWINYYPRMSGLCELFEDADTDPDLQPRESVWVSSKSEWEYDEPSDCQTCLDYEMCTPDTGQTCKTVSCPNLVPSAVNKLLGNRYHKRATMLYICGNREHQLITCSGDGSWTNVSLLCCRNTQPIVKHGSLDTAESEDRMEATIVCDSGYANLGDIHAMCDESGRVWASLDRSACVKLQEDPWILVYGKMHGASGGVWDSLDNANTGNGDFRNAAILESWDSHNILKVKYEVLDFSDKVVVTLTFEGGSGDIKSWFSQENLDQSFWTDLEPNSPQGIKFSIHGIKAKIEEGREELGNSKIRIRWGILEHDTNDNDKIIDCSSHKIWLGIMKAADHPCEDVRETRGVSGHVIVYSSTDTGTVWNDRKWKMAKMMLVYVHIQ